MFTGIVEERGQVVALDDLADAARLTVRGPLVCTGTPPGASIAVNGCCLTVTEVDDDRFTADVMAETLRATTLGRLRPGSTVNLERAVTPTGRLGGHLVQGHVDGIAVVRAREPAEHWELVRVELPAALARYVVAKGSIAVDGVSLTVVTVNDAGWFSVSLIPATLEATTLGDVAVGNAVNLEVDVVAKYVERLVTTGAERDA
jgi:riboflavin synthase